jgi:hypothetical protein
MVMSIGSAPDCFVRVLTPWQEQPELGAFWKISKFYAVSADIL